MSHWINMCFVDVSRGTNKEKEKFSTPVFYHWSLWYPSICDQVLTQRYGQHISHFSFQIKESKKTFKNLVCFLFLIIFFFLWARTIPSMLLQSLAVKFEIHIWLSVETVTHEKLGWISLGFQSRAKSRWTGTLDKLRRIGKTQETLTCCINF